MSQIVTPIRARGRILHWLGPLALLVVAAAVVMVITSAPVGGGAGHPQTERRARPAHRHGHHHAAYWMVRPGDTLAQISAKTGVSVRRLEAYNPNADPQALAIGERLRLRAHPPPPRPAKPKPPGPLFWTVRPGQSYGFIAAATGINLARLEHLNPKLPPTKVQPGDQIQLRSTATVERATVLAAGKRAAALARLRLGH
jgi:lipoprotein NlpD